jgi:hypothetical protein
MDFPTIKKPKSNKQLSANIQGSKESLFAKLSSMEGQATATPPAAAKVPSAKTGGAGKQMSATMGGAKGLSADITDDDSDIENAAEEAAEKAIKSTGSDKSDKAEAVRIRALLMKSRANSLGEKNSAAEEFNPKRKKK